MNRDLSPFIAEASLIFLAEWEGLAEWGEARAVTPAALLDWSSRIEHNWGKFRGYNGAAATASRRSLSISYNPFACNDMEDELLLDLALHEMAHLFCNWFITPDPVKEDCGHDWRWQNVCAVIGCAWVSCTTDERRWAYIKAAKQERILRKMKRALLRAA